MLEHQLVAEHAPCRIRAPHVLVKGDAYIPRGHDERLPLIIDIDPGPHDAADALVIKFPAERLRTGEQKRVIAAPDTFQLLFRQRRAGLADVSALLDFAFQPDDVPAAVINTDTVLFSLGKASQLIFIGCVPVIVKIQTADMILTAKGMNVGRQHHPQAFAEQFRIAFIDEILEFVSESHTHPPVRPVVWCRPALHKSNRRRSVFCRRCPGRFPSPSGFYRSHFVPSPGRNTGPPQDFL